MARGTAQQSNKLMFKVAYENNKPKSGKPFFAEMVKNGDNWEPQGEDTFLEGKLVGIEKSSYVYEGDTNYTFKLIIDGGDETYSLELNYSYYTRSLLNSLSSITDFGLGTINISIYRNSKGYTTLMVRYSAGECDWTIPFDKLPPVGDDKWIPSFDHFIGLIAKAIPEQLGGGSDDSMPNNMELETEHAEAVEEKKAAKKGKGSAAAKKIEEAFNDDDESVQPLPF